MDINCSYPFTPMIVDGEIILRPLLQCTLSCGGKTFETLLLVDSGADYSMLKREVARDGLMIDLDRLTPIGETGGVGGETKIARTDIGVSFRMGKYLHECTIPFQISLEEGKDPAFSLLGRIPFFYDFRVSFRMGYTDDPALGKFNLHLEQKKRSAGRYKKPVKFG
jgi:hypothetical protein